jgi:hypothetical protein
MQSHAIKSRAWSSGATSLYGKLESKVIGFHDLLLLPAFIEK